MRWGLVEQGQEAAEEQGVRVRASNKHFFASTAGLLLNWRLVLDGAPLAIGDVLSQSPQGWHPGGTVAIPPGVRAPPLALSGVGRGGGAWSGVWCL